MNPFNAPAPSGLPYLPVVFTSATAYRRAAGLVASIGDFPVLGVFHPISNLGPERIRGCLLFISDFPARGMAEGRQRYVRRIWEEEMKIWEDAQKAESEGTSSVSRTCRLHPQMFGL